MSTIIHITVELFMQYIQSMNAKISNPQTKNIYNKYKKKPHSILTLILFTVFFISYSDIYNEIRTPRLSISNVPN